MNRDDRRALKRSRVMTRLWVLTSAARSSAFTVGVRTRQPVEVQRLQRRIRDVSERWSPLWTTAAAANALPGARLELEHVVPVVVLVERILTGDEVEAVLEQGVVCRVTHEEHKKHLAVAFRRVHSELYARMLACPISELSALGWERYRAVGLSCVEVPREDRCRSRASNVSCRPIPP